MLELNQGGAFQVMGMFDTVTCEYPLPNTAHEHLEFQTSDHWGYEDRVYRFYHQSFKVYDLQRSTDRVVGENSSKRQRWERWGAGRTDATMRVLSSRLVESAFALPPAQRRLSASFRPPLSQPPRGQGRGPRR
jgi:hypothetical protein